jgi:hypothetical protein
MKFSRIVAITLVAALLAMLAPQMPVFADGSASTRNILLLGAAAGTLIIINHNKQVHAKYAADAAAEASLAAQRNDAQTAYASEKKAYENEVALVGDLKNEVAYQHSIVVQQQKQLASLEPAGSRTSSATPFVAQTTVVKPTPVGGTTEVAATSYGWGTI